MYKVNRKKDDGNYSDQYIIDECRYWCAEYRLRIRCQDTGKSKEERKWEYVIEILRKKLWLVYIFCNDISFEKKQKRSKKNIAQKRENKHEPKETMMISVTVTEIGEISYYGSRDTQWHQIAQNCGKGKQQSGQPYFLFGQKAWLDDEQTHSTYSDTDICDDAISDALTLYDAQMRIIILQV